MCDIVRLNFFHREEDTMRKLTVNIAIICSFIIWSLAVTSADVGVAAGYAHTVGLKSDMTVVAVGSNDYGQCDVEGGTNILQVAAGGYHTVGVMTNKTVVAVGSNSSGQCNVNSWNLGDPCLLETIYGEFSPEAELLRYFRDHLLSATPEGQELIRLYYQLSPGIVGLIEGDEPFRKEIKDLVDEMLPRLLQ
jgi:hypothetical protein